MPKSVLLINSSPLGEHSVSRKLTAKIIDKMKTETPDATIVERDLSAVEMPHFSAMNVGAAYRPDQFSEDQINAALALSNELVDELLAADVIVIGAPMWNFSIPSCLKAWVDHIVRPGRTFSYSNAGAQGLVSADKKVIVASSRGGMYSSGPTESMDHQETLLTTVLGFIGLTDITFVRAEGLGMGEEAVAAAMATAEATIAESV